MEDYIVNLIAVGVMSWATLFLVIRKVVFPKRSFDFCNRIVSTVHACLAVTLACLSVQDWSCPVCPLASKSSHKQCGSEMVGCLWVTEISSPFVHMRELLKDLGYRDIYLNLTADIGFAVIFTFGRMVCGPYLCYVTLSADNPLLIKAMAFGLQLVSAFWFYKIVRMVVYKLGRRTTSSIKLTKNQ